MSYIDKQRSQPLVQLGYTFAGDDWMHPIKAKDATITNAIEAYKAIRWPLGVPKAVMASNSTENAQP